MFRTSLLLPIFLLGTSTLALADDPQVYKWTDAQGTVHYSDQPPAKPAPDLTAAAMPSFPPVDEARAARRQAALLAEVTALQRINQVQLDQQIQAADLARQRAESEAASEAQQAAQDQPTPAEPIYINSDFVPHVYRANLYLAAGHRVHEHRTPPSQPLPVKPAIPVLVKP
jgi:hypothetical protein